MLKKLTVLLLSVLGFTACAALAACETEEGGEINGDKPTHEKHTYSQEIIEPTCTEEGYTVYKCECGDSFKDDFVPANKHQEKIIAGTPSTCETHGLSDGIVCTVCKEVISRQEELPLAEHSLKTLDGKHPTCTEPGYTQKTYCTVCDTVIEESEELQPNGHAEETISGREPTCTEEGLSEGIKCVTCGETVIKQEILPVKGHTPEIIPEQPANCLETGWTEYSICIDCNEMITYGEEIPKAPHTEIPIPAKTATCASPGWTEGAKCSYCGVITSEPEEIIVPHTENIISGMPASCDSQGYTDAIVCSVCNITITPSQPIPCIPHTPEVIQRCEPTCLSPGNEEYERCSVCFTFLTEYITIPELGHNPTVIPEIPATCTSTGLSEGIKCSRCSYVIKQQQTTPYAHKLASEHDDLIHYDKCSLCGIKENESEHAIAQNKCEECGYAPDFTAGLVYEKVSGGYAVGGRGCATDTHIRIPSEINGIPVISIVLSRFDIVDGVGKYVSAFENESGIISVTAPSSIKTFGGFINCPDLVSITVSEGTEEITAIRDCPNLLSIELPSTVKKFRATTFEGCPSLTRVDFAGTVSDWVNIEFADMSNPVRCSRSLYLNGELLETLILPEDVKEIKLHAFTNCESLKEIIALGDTLHISHYAFSDCVNLNKLILPSNTTVANPKEFENCTNITEASLHADFFEFIPKGKLVKINVNSGARVPDGTFENCYELAEISFAECVSEIGKYAFRNCTAIKEFNLPEHISLIKQGAFENCNLVKGELVLHDNLTVEADAFKNWNDLTEITSGEISLTVGNAFTGCVNLKTINVNAADFTGGFGYMSDNQTDGIVINIGAKVKKIPAGFLDFYGYEQGVRVNFKEVNFAENSVLEEIGKRAFFGMTEYNKVIIDNGSTINSKAFTVPDGVKTIGDEAFMYCTSIEYFHFPNTLESIGNRAFYGCEKFSTVFCGEEISKMPESIKTVGEQAFMNCTRLENAIYKEGVISIGAEAYTNCTNLNNVVLPRTLKSLGLRAFGYDENGAPIHTINRLTIPADVLFWTQQNESGIGVRSINNTSAGIQELELTYSTHSYALSSSTYHTITDKDIRNLSNLKIIKLWDNIAKFEYNSFGCSKLCKIYYMASKEKWDKIEKDVLWDNGMGTFNEVNRQVNLYCINNDGVEETYVLKEAASSR